MHSQYDKLYCRTFLITLAICLLSQAIALREVGGKTVKCESNFFSSLARVQSGIKDNPQTMFLGSSITGRLPDRNNGFKGCVNMGCDGSSAVDVLIAMDTGIIPTAQNIIIEGNTLLMSIEQKETEVSKALRSPWFKLGKYIDAISYTARPSAFFYSKLLGNRIGLNQGPNNTTTAIATAPYIPDRTTLIYLTSDQELFTMKIIDIIERLRDRGVEIWLVMLPPVISEDSMPYNIALTIASKAKIPFFDLAAGFNEDEIIFTDGLHMSPKSATLTMNVITQQLDSYKH